MYIFYPKITTRRFKPARLFQLLVQITAAVILAACGTFSAPRMQQPLPLTTAPSTSGSVPHTGQGQIFQISIRDFNFQPAELTVPVGATVVWTAVGHDPHTVTADDQSFKSNSLNTGATFKYTFTKVGTFSYYCEYHGYKGGAGMSGTVRVVALGSSSTAPGAAFVVISAASGGASVDEQGGSRPKR